MAKGEQRERKEYPSCMCGRVECGCPCVSGGMRGGEVVPNMCFDYLCDPHERKCRRPFRNVSDI